MKNQSPTLFISYDRTDSDFVRRLARDLHSSKVCLWVDQLNIRPGVIWDRAVEEALHSCRSLLVVLSPDSVHSTNVMDEVAFALDNQKIVFPIVYKKCDIPYRLSRLQRVDFTGDYTGGLEQLKRALDAGSVVELEPARVRAHPSRFWSGWALIAEICTLVLIGSLFYYRFYSWHSWGIVIEGFDPNSDAVVIIDSFKSMSKAVSEIKFAEFSLVLTRESGLVDPRFAIYHRRGFYSSLAVYDSQKAASDALTILQDVHNPYRLIGKVVAIDEFCPDARKGTGPNGYEFYECGS